MSNIIFAESKSGKDLFNKSNVKTYILAGLIYAAISLLMFWPITSGIKTTVPNNMDVFNMLWNIWWVNYATFTLHTSIFHTTLLYYPVGANLASEPFLPIASFLAIPLQSISLAFEYNILFFIGYILSGIFSFILVYYLTGNKYAAFIGGLVFAFSPMHIAQSYAHLNWTMIEWIPLFLLFFILTINEKKQIYIMGAAVSFVLLTFMGDLQQAIMTSVLAIFILAYLLIRDKKIVLNRQMISNLAELIILVLIIGSPIFVPLGETIIHSSVLSTAGESSSLLDSTLWSNNLLSFFLPSVYNGIFTGLANSHYASIYQNSQETISYIGFSVLILSTFAVLYYNKHKHNGRNAVKMWLLMLVIFAWLSTGPLLIVGKYVAPVPGPFVIYHYIPIFSVIREPGRFDLLATLALAVLSGFGVKVLLDRIGTSKKKSMLKIYAVIAIALIVLVEYNGAPTGSSASYLFTNTTIPSAYYTINSTKNNSSVMILPDSINTYSGYTARVMYYQTLFKEPIIGGYTSRINLTEYYSVANISLSKIGENTSLLSASYNSPIMENYTSNTLQSLSDYNVSIVGVINGAYNQTSRQELTNYLKYLFGSPIYQSNSTTLFSTANAISTYRK